MGHYAELFIDRLYLSWKSYVPTFLTFLFKESDFYVVRDPEEPEWPEEIGFRTTCRDSIDVLERNEYTIDFLTSIYEFFESDLNNYYIESAKYRINEEADWKLTDIECDQCLTKHIELYPTLTRKQELKDFLKFIGFLLASDLNSPPFDEPVVLKFQDDREYEIPPSDYLFAKGYKDYKLIDFENLQMYVHDKPLKFPPWILKICGLFDDYYMFEYPEVISLMFVRMALESVSPDAEIKLDLSDIIEVEGTCEEQDDMVRALHTSLAHSLVKKVNLYNRVFQPLFRNENQIREKYIKEECRDLLASCDKVKNVSEKGKRLERLTELLFTANELFELVNKRVSTGDEEIDLVIKNNVDRPFWNALQSPLFFVECKNWKNPVGAKELRDFESKLRNHKKLAKVGFFVAINGYTSGVTTELQRGGREDQHVVIIDRADLDEYLRGSEDFFSWLEKRVAKLY